MHHRLLITSLYISSAIVMSMSAQLPRRARSSYEGCTNAEKAVALYNAAHCIGDKAQTLPFVTGRIGKALRRDICNVVNEMRSFCLDQACLTPKDRPEALAYLTNTTNYVINSRLRKDRDESVRLNLDECYYDSTTRIPLSQGGAGSSTSRRPQGSRNHATTTMMPSSAASTVLLAFYIVVSSLELLI